MKRDITVVNLPCSLHDTLSLLRKDDLLQIASAWDISGVTGLRKAELASALARQMPLKAPAYFTKLEHIRVDMLETLIKEKHGVPLDETLAAYIYPLLISGAFTVGHFDGEARLTLPDEIADAYRKHRSRDYQELVMENTTIVQLVRGFVCYYGVIETEYAESLVSIMLGHDINDLSYRFHRQRVLEQAAHWGDLFMRTDGYYVHPLLKNLPGFLDQRGQMQGLGYRLNTIDAYLEAAHFGCPALPHGEQTFVATLVHEFDLSREVAASLTGQAYVASMLGEPPDAVAMQLVDAADETMPVGDDYEDLLDTLVYLLEEMLPSMPDWAYYGYSHRELQELAKGMRRTVGPGNKGKLVDLDSYRSK